MKTAPNDNPWNLDAELHLRAATYARRAQLTRDNLVDLAIADFFFAYAEPWREGLSAVAALALMEFIGLCGYLITIRHIVSDTKQKLELPNNRWNFPPLLHAVVATIVTDAGTTYDELLLVALRDYLHRPVPPGPQRQALATLVAFALADYLEEREPPAPSAHSLSAAARRTDN